LVFVVVVVTSLYQEEALFAIPLPTISLH